MPDLHITTSAKIRLVAAELRRLGDDRTIVNEMTKRIRRQAGPIRKAIKKSAVDTLPKTGGLGAATARSTVRVSVRRGERSAGVSIVVTKKSPKGKADLNRLDLGSLRHPLWGNRKHWYPQTVTPGFATKPVEGPIADQFVRDVNEAVDAAIEEVLGRG